MCVCMAVKSYLTQLYGSPSRLQDKSGTANADLIRSTIVEFGMNLDIHALLEVWQWIR